MNGKVLSSLFLLTACAIGAEVRRSTPVFPEDLEIDSLNSVSRIIQGKPASPGQFPWMVSIYLYREQVRFFCGGSLISKRWILTAAHCTNGSSMFIVSLGSTLKDGEEVGRITVYTDKSATHEGYDSVTLENDIGLIDLGIDIEESDYVKTIRLPAKGDVLGVNEEVVVSGWGYTNRSVPGTSPNLNYLNLRTISNDDCVKVYGQSLIFPSTVCTIGKGIQSPCDGDSGSSLITLKNGTATHVAVTSFVPDDGCDLGQASGYIRTESYLDWISNHTGIKV